MSSSNQRKHKRKMLLKELARQSILKFAPEPITPQEIHDYNWMKIIKGLIKHARYHKPPTIWTEINKPKLTSKPLKTTIINVKG